MAISFIFVLNNKLEDCQSEFIVFPSLNANSYAFAFVT